MGKKKTKFVGSLRPEVAYEIGIPEHSNKEIIQTSSLYKHITKHIDEFLNLDSYNYTISHVSDVINDYEYVFYNSEQDSIEYYKKLLENVSVVIKLHESKTYFYVASIYPVTEMKIENRKKKIPNKQLYDKYIKKITID